MSPVGIFWPLCFCGRSSWRRPSCSNSARPMSGTSTRARVWGVPRWPCPRRAMASSVGLIPCEASKNWNLNRFKAYKNGHLLGYEKLLLYWSLIAGLKRFYCKRTNAWSSLKSHGIHHIQPVRATKGGKHQTAARSFGGHESDAFPWAVEEEDLKKQRWSHRYLGI